MAVSHAAPQSFHGKDAVLSGPAGGVVGMAETARAAGFHHVIGFDMGGTSTDVSRFDGIYERNHDNQVAGVRLRVPMMAIHTIAAGGGSILHYDGARFRVGPDSAGSNPGPMSYRGGGPLTVTDANVMTGKLQPENFPRIFGGARDQSLDAESVREAFSRTRARKTGRTAEEVADGFIRIAVENMANAIKAHFRRVRVVTMYWRYALACFRRKAPVDSTPCLVAEYLPVRLVSARIFIHPFSGRTLRLWHAARCHTRLPPSRDRTWSRYRIGRKSRRDCAGDGAMRTLPLKSRPQGGYATLIPGRQYISVTLAATDARCPARDGRRNVAHFRRGACAAIRLRHRGQTADRGSRSRSKHSAMSPRQPYSHPEPAAAASFKLLCAAPASTRKVRVARLRRVLKVDEIEAGAVKAGPAIIVEPHQTIIVEPGWQAEVTPARAVILSRKEEISVGKTDQQKSVDFPCCSKYLQICSCRSRKKRASRSRTTASSVNIKERLDFSCAIFDAEGNLVANAPHMPVHLGSMGDCVTSIIEKFGDEITEGDMFATSAPYNGGTHLPDITVVALPVFIDGERKFFTAARGPSRRHAAASLPAPCRHSPAISAKKAHCLTIYG